ncbi:MAG: NAD-dependent epimerase/dehydratase family protein [Planctomycetales bacterium]|nr:NAD-dependent epimerase/dehydratase family protein [Planctomycetales bacterium]
MTHSPPPRIDPTQIDAGRTDPTRRLVIGCGYLGARAAALWHTRGDEVHVVTRSPEKAERWNHRGYHAWVADVVATEGWQQIPEVDTILYAVGYDRKAAPSIDDVYVGGVLRTLRQFSKWRRFVYVSSTGVYGTADGDGWVDESTPPNPQRPGGVASWHAEQALAADPRAGQAVALRMAGLYGPGRVPWSDALQRGDALAVEPEGWLNLIHIDDAAQIVAEATDWELDEEVDRLAVYCVSDGHPVVRRDYYTEAARLLGVDAPSFAIVDPDSPAAQRARVSRRVSSAKLQKRRGYALHYPSYREGLVHALGGADTTFY